MANPDEKHHIEEFQTSGTPTQISGICSGTRECLEDIFDKDKYKVHSIADWMNDIFFVSPKYKDYLKSKLDLSRKVSIKQLLNEIKKDEGGNSENAPITHAPVIYFAEETLEEEYMDAFLDYLEEENEEISSYVSIERFLELLSSFEQEGIKRLREWAEERLISDDYEKFIEYCKDKGYKSNHFISDKKFGGLKEEFDKEKKSLEEIV